MNKYEITLQGCDDSTVFEVETNDVGLALLLYVADLSVKASTDGCQPVMKVARAS